jgi:hypothetical protein
MKHGKILAAQKQRTYATAKSLRTARLSNADRRLAIAL